jgi:hypothetical protein
MDRERVGSELGIAAQDQSAAIGGGQVHVEHLDGSELVEDGARGQAGGKRAEPRSQGDMQAVGDCRWTDILGRPWRVLGRPLDHHRDPDPPVDLRRQTLPV